MKKWCLLIVAGAFLASACGVSTASEVSFSGTRVPKVKAAASFDVVAMDQAEHRLYATDRTDQGVDEFDTTKAPAKFLRTVPVAAAPNGLAVAPDLGRVFVGLSDGSVAIIDTRTGASTADTVVQDVATGAGPVDLIDYSALLHRVYAAGDGVIASLDATTGAVQALFKIGYALEQPRFNPGDGMLYVTSPAVSTLYQLDPLTGQVKSKIALGYCEPKGLAIDPKTNQAVVACRVTAVRVNLKNPSDMTTFLQVRGGDVATYDAAADRFVIGAPNQLPTSVGILGGNPIAYIASVQTDAGGSSAVLDDANRVIYSPDTRAGKAGLIGFALPTGEVAPAVSVPWSSLALLGGMLGAIALVVVLVSRKADPVNRPVPTPRRRRA